MTSSWRPMDATECFALLVAGSIGRVAITHRALPLVFPVVYTVDAERVLFTARPDSVLAEGCDGKVIAFGVDDLSRETDAVQAVNVVGLAGAIDHTSVAESRRHRIPHDAPDEGSRLFALPLSQVSGECRSVDRSS